MTADDLHFIVSQGPKLQKDPSIRSIIRKHAMKNVAAERRKRGDFGRVNVRQLPVFEDPSGGSSHSTTRSEGDTSSDPDSSRSSTAPDDVEDDELEPIESTVLIRRPAMIPEFSQPSLYLGLSSDYQKARSTFQVDVTDLAMLTNWNVGYGTIPVLSADPTRLVTLMGHPMWSYLQFVPTHYGASKCLTAATDCLLARVRSIIMPHRSNKELELKLYTRALRSLQDALQDNSLCLKSDVLCATQLLGLHELLDPAGHAAWSYHLQGSARLIRHRTPKRFTSEFDKALFAGHLGPIINEAFRNNKHCYLEEPEWLKLHQSMIEPSEVLTDRSPLAIGIRSLMFITPGMWHDTEVTVKSQALFDPIAMSALETRCRKIHTSLFNWMESYKNYCTNVSLTAPTSQELNTRRELLGMALECLAVIKRLLATLCDGEREVLESEALAVAQSIYDLQKQPGPKHVWLLSGPEIGLAQSVLMTTDDWAGPFVYTSEHERILAVRKRFVRWSDLLRMDSPGKVIIEVQDAAV